MIFDNLHKLGPEKFGKIKNELMLGTPAISVARMIQQEWKDYQNVQEKTLSQQLTRMRLRMIEGAFGSDVAREVKKIAVIKGPMKPVIEALEGVSLNALEKMEELVSIQRERVIQFYTKEKTFAIPMMQLNTVVGDYSKLLQDYQKMRFDLGCEEFKGPISGFRGMATSVSLPDGTNMQKVAYEAVGAMEQVFESRGIGPVSKLRE